MEDNHIHDELTRSFVAELRRAEQEDDTSRLSALFDTDAELFRLDGDGTRRGDVDGFWKTYLAQFGEVRTRFLNAVESAGGAALEWESEGTRPNGHPFRYQGSTFLTLGGDRIQGLRTYYDTAAFLDVEAGTNG